jgi:hypothetical protein
MSAPIRVQKSWLQQQHDLASRLAAGLSDAEYEVFAGLLRFLELLLADGRSLHTVVFVRPAVESANDPVPGPAARPDAAADLIIREAALVALTRHLAEESDELFAGEPLLAALDLHAEVLAAVHRQLQAQLGPAPNG